MTIERKINGAKHREILYPDHLTQTPEWTQIFLHDIKLKYNQDDNGVTMVQVSKHLNPTYFKNTLSLYILDRLFSVKLKVVELFFLT